MRASPRRRAQGCSHPGEGMIYVEYIFRLNHRSRKKKCKSGMMIRSGATEAGFTGVSISELQERAAFHVRGLNKFTIRTDAKTLLAVGVWSIIHPIYPQLRTFSDLL